jgi:putative toxin-antitoxin system antitoxin component (TIGR02293 family)
VTATATAGSGDRELRAPTPAEIRAGLPVSFLDRLKGTLEVSETQPANVVGIPHQTLVRRRSQGVLRPDEGDRAAELARVLDRALSYFDGERRHALEWLKHPHRAVGGDTPLEHAGTLAGAEEVIDLIGWLEHGIPS